MFLFMLLDVSSGFSFVTPGNNINNGSTNNNKKDDSFSFVTEAMRLQK